jgi:hypothetical protein
VARAEGGDFHEDHKHVPTDLGGPRLRDGGTGPRVEPTRRARLPAEAPDAIARALRRLGDRDPFDPAAEAGLQALRALVAAELGEAQDAAHSDAMPPDGEDPAQTARAEALAALLDVFDRFLISRDITLDQIAAERALQRLMRAGG